MEKIEARRCRLQETIGGQLAGKQLVLAGLANEERRLFLENFMALCGQSQADFEVADGLEQAKPGDLILLFANPGQSMQELHGESCRNRSRQDWGAVCVSWEETLRLLAELGQLARLKPQAALLVSGNAVYGRMFGRQRAVKEEELGYLCHTDGRDAAGQCMRTAEHFAGRIAREQGVPVKIARMGAIPSGEELSLLLETAIRVLLCGRAGETYNLPGGEGSRCSVISLEERRAGKRGGQKAGEQDAGAASGTREYLERSALRPISCVTDTEKAKGLGKESPCDCETD